MKKTSKILYLFGIFFIYFTNALFHRVSFKHDKKIFAKKSLLRNHMFFLILLFTIFFKTTRTSAYFIPDMKMSATPNPVGSGARALGIGGAFISIADDATAASWNPGALLNLKRTELSIVGSYFSGKREYNTDAIDGDIDDLSSGKLRLNHLGAVFPFKLYKRNMVFSLNYQHLYEFSKDTSYKWLFIHEEPGIGPVVNIPMTSHKTQSGALDTLSPAIAIEVIPSLYLGLTANFWLDDNMNDLSNQWENLNIVQGEGTTLVGLRIKSYAELYERYQFSGLNIFKSICFNLNIGTLWHINQKITLGGVIKTPFKAKIKREYRSFTAVEYPEIPDSLDTQLYEPPPNTLTLEMPLSLGLGISIRFSDYFLMSLDIYSTQWDDYLLSGLDPNSDEKVSPINNKPEDQADINSTIQIRFGTEYLIKYEKKIIPIRAGIFYDPEPASGSPDDLYGISFGTGITFEDFVFDIAYQYRFGNKKIDEEMLGEEISCDVKQHYLYSSIIFYY